MEMMEGKFLRVGVVLGVGLVLGLLAGCQNMSSQAGTTGASQQQNQMTPFIKGPTSAPHVKGPTAAPPEMAASSGLDSSSH